MIPLTSTQLDAQRAFQNTLGEKAPLFPRYYGLLGNGTGQVEVDGRPGWVYVRLPALKDAVIAALNARVSNTHDLPVVVGLTQEHPNILQVLSVDFTDAVLEGSNTGEINAANLPTHHHTHEWRGENGGNDVVIVQTRQIAPLRPVITTGFNLVIERGLCPTDLGWLQIERTVLDLTSLVTALPLKTGEGCYLLIYVDRLGNLTHAIGKKQNTGLLSYRDIPYPAPFGGYAICGLRCYQGQSAFQDSETVTDMVDLRFAQPNYYNILNGLIAKLGESLARVLGLHVAQG